jgi:hypothetical protein
MWRSLLTQEKSISETIGPLRRLCNLSPLNLDAVKGLLDEYIRQTHRSVDLILIGGLALQAYGVHDRITVDIDGELAGELEPLLEFLRSRQVPADLGENISGWSVVAMPPGYRDRTSVWHEDGRLRIRLLHPVDFVIAKLRRGTEQDLDDAQEVVIRFHLTSADIQIAANSAIQASPKDTALFTFRKIVDVFCQRMGKA